MYTTKGAGDGMHEPIRCALAFGSLQGLVKEVLESINLLCPEGTVLWDRHSNIRELRAPLH